MSVSPVVRWLGQVAYEPTWQAMLDFTAARNEDTPDELWVCQHPPVYTLGQAGKPEHLLHDNGIPLVKIDRGGQITYHGPGQLVVYLLLDLARRGLKVRELVALTRAYYPDPLDLDACLALAGLEGVQHRRYGRLSGGQQRRVQFAMAVCGRPQLLFLDEPTTGLDIDARQGLWRAIRDLAAQGCAVLLTTHYLEEAEALADRVMVIGQGRLLAQGTVDEMRARVAQRRIGCISSLAPAQVAAWPGVQEARAGDDGRQRPGRRGARTEGRLPPLHSPRAAGHRAGGGAVELSLPDGGERHHPGADGR